MTNKIELYKKAAELWGNSFEYLIAIEEMSELTSVLLAQIRQGTSDTLTGLDIDAVEEIADSIIMLEQLLVIAVSKDPELGCLYKDIKSQKLERLETRINEYLVSTSPK